MNKLDKEIMDLKNKIHEKGVEIFELEGEVEELGEELDKLKDKKLALKKSIKEA